MSGCLLIGAALLNLSGTDFRLEWTHSVERSAWHEDWQVLGDTLRLNRAAVRGSGAGMEPGEGAVLENGWWVWAPTLPPQRSLVLAASGVTGGGWRLCDGAVCREIGAQPGQPIEIRPCP